MALFKKTLTSRDDIFTTFYRDSEIHGGDGNDILIYQPQTGYEPDDPWYEDVLDGIGWTLETLYELVTLDWWDWASFSLDLSNGAAALFGEGGDDVLSNRSDSSICLMSGGIGNDQFVLGGAEVVTDTGTFSMGADIVDGGEGDDIVYAFDAGTLNEFDRLDGGDGIDTLTIFACAGGDFLDFASGSTKVGAQMRNFEHLEYNGSEGGEVVKGAEWADSIGGGGGNDFLYGRGGNDVLAGGGGNDNLYGEDGEDLLVGGAGADWLIGGLGRDTMTGGADNDVFSFARDDSPAYVNGVFFADIIADFEDSGENQDVINLLAIDGNETLAGKQSMSFNNGDAIRDPGELFLSTTINAAGQIVSMVFADRNSDGVADFALQFDRRINTIEASDFLFSLPWRDPGTVGDLPVFEAASFGAIRPELGGLSSVGVYEVLG